MPGDHRDAGPNRVRRPLDGGPVRVLHSIATIGYGGVERRHLQIVKRLGGNYTHAFVCPDAFGPVADELAQREVPVFEMGPSTSRGLPLRTLQIARIARAWRPDIVHGAVIEGYAPGVPAGRLVGATTIAEETSDPTNRRVGGDIVAKVAGTAADYCVGVSEAAVRYWSGLSIPERKIRLITNGVAEPHRVDAPQRRALRSEWGIPADCLVVGSVGRMVDDHKRFSDLIRCLPMLEPSVRLLIAGDGPDLGALREFAARSGVADRVIFTGAQDDIGTILSMMDVFALPSAREAFGLVIAEAMLCQLPVVATRVGGIPDVTEEGVTGLLVPPLEPRALADALRRLLNDPAARAEMGRAGRERALARFSVERYAADVEQLYREALLRRRTRRAHR